MRLENQIFASRRRKFILRILKLGLCDCRGCSLFYLGAQDEARQIERGAAILIPIDSTGLFIHRRLVESQIDSVLQFIA